MRRSIHKRQIDDMSRMLLDALVAYRLDAATEDHRHNILAQLLIAKEVATKVQRHNHLLGHINESISAVLVDPVDIDTVELGCEITKALYLSTTKKTLRRCIRKVLNEISKPSIHHA